MGNDTVGKIGLRSTDECQTKRPPRGGSGGTRDPRLSRERRSPQRHPGCGEPESVRHRHAFYSAAPLSFSPSPTALASGAITGRLGYPSEFILPLTVYAISTTDRRVWFSVDVPRFPSASPATPLPTGTFRPGEEPRYTITGVALGTYVVLAYRNDGQLPAEPGAYTQAVINCRPGAPSAACSDRSLVPVTVAPGQTVSGIDVTDWGFLGPGQTSPSVPPRPTPR